MVTLDRSPALYNVWPRQQRALELLGLAPNPVAEPVEEMLYGGQAGGGKSFLMRAAAVTIATLWPGSVVPLFRRTYPELEETHIRAMQREMTPGIATYHDARHEMRFVNGSVVEFRYCERDSDVYRYQSAEWDALLIDEATHFSEEQVRYLRSRVRSTRPGWHPIMLYTTNPGNRSHAYFKAGFVDAAPDGQVFTAPRDDGGLRRCFLRARLDDNPSLGGDYRRLLEGIADVAQRRALLDGDWDVFAGQYFSEWRRDKHVIDPFTPPAHWRRFAGLDWGHAKPLAYLLLAQDPDTGRLFVLREVYAAGLRDAEAIARIKAIEGQDRIDARWADPSMWTKRSNDDALSTADVYLRAGLVLQPASNDRLNGWRRLHDLLADGKDERPMLQVCRNCTELIRTLPGLVHDQTRPEDLNSDGEDHASDALRYCVASRLTAQLKDPPLTMPFKWG